MNHSRALPAALVIALFLSSGVALAQPSKKPAKDNKAKKGGFLRLTRDADDSPVALEVAIVRFRPADAKKKGVTIDLIGAVHVGEGAYYSRLNREFARYDSVLYELVAPEGTRIPKGGGTGSRHPVSLIQGGMKNMLELEFQLEKIDYTKKNLRHADMSPKQFAESMKNRGESMFGTFLRMMGYAMAQQNKGGGTSDMQLLAALFNKDRAMALKRVMAEQFEDMEGSLNVLDGPDGSTIVSERNKVALGVLKERIEAGDKKIAIFYGAAHMPDFQKRLLADFGVVRGKTRWLVAWNLKPAKEKP